MRKRLILYGFFVTVGFGLAIFLDLFRGGRPTVKAEPKLSRLEAAVRDYKEAEKTCGRGNVYHFTEDETGKSVFTCGNWAEAAYPERYK